MRWLGHVVHMADGRIPKDLLYGKLAQDKRPTATHQLRYKAFCKRDLKAMDVDLTTWEAVVSDGLRLDGFEADCALRKACPPLNSHSHNMLRQRERVERPEAKLT